MVFTAFETEGSRSEFTQAPFGTSPPEFTNKPPRAGGVSLRGVCAGKYEYKYLGYLVSKPSLANSSQPPPTSPPPTRARPGNFVRPLLPRATLRAVFTYEEPRLLLPADTVRLTDRSIEGPRGAQRCASRVKSPALGLEGLDT